MKQSIIRLAVKYRQFVQVASNSKFAEWLRDDINEQAVVRFWTIVTLIGIADALLLISGFIF